MSINLDFPDNIISASFSILGWVFMVLIVVRQYSKQQEKPALWKALIITWLGIAAVTINLNLFHTAVKLPILPIGVWLIYAVTRNKSWGRYRVYAWIGFWGNFIFLAAALLSSPVNEWIYPKKEVSTYIASMDHATIIPIHPSASETALIKEHFFNQLELIPTKDMVFDWYSASKFVSQPYYQQERFPYQLSGTKPKWGSGIFTEIYIEDNGKGILITTPKQQYYYRSPELLINGEGLHEK
ncbi:MAG: hypothetical protein ACE3L7_06625 [Candidatus Pristimantibacillus sp.]